eukprot:CCRYP_014567-RA/>CCRYP_014567-RA protein AED:0.52 eAED:0.62 QI:0/0/0/1/0/0/2/0/234
MPIAHQIRLLAASGPDVFLFMHLIGTFGRVPFWLPPTITYPLHRRNSSYGINACPMPASPPSRISPDNGTHTSCDNLLSAPCEISKATRPAPTIHSSRIGAPHQMVLKENHVKPGDCFSCDHFISPVPGGVTSHSGHSSSRNSYTCGTIYVDNCSTFLFIYHQLTTAASDTIRGKMLLESEAADVGVTIKQYHSDNGVFISAEFREHCTRLGQTLCFSGIGAHHQAIQTITNMA